MKPYVILTFIALICCFTKARSQDLDALLKKYNNNSVPYISAEELKMLSKNNNVIILDAREPEEFNISHIKKAIPAGYDNFSVTEISHNISEASNLIVVYCSVGIRSEDIAEKLKKQGFKNIKNLYGGIFEWKNKGFSVFDNNGIETDSVHAYSKHWGKYLNRGIKVY